jgi:hypothetical protein
MVTTHACPIRVARRQESQAWQADGVCEGAYVWTDRCRLLTWLKVDLARPGTLVSRITSRRLVFSLIILPPRVPANCHLFSSTLPSTLPTGTYFVHDSAGRGELFALRIPLTAEHEHVSPKFGAERHNFV